MNRKKQEEKPRIERMEPQMDADKRRSERFVTIVSLSAPRLLQTDVGFGKSCRKAAGVLSAGGLLSVSCIALAVVLCLAAPTTAAPTSARVAAKVGQQPVYVSDVLRRLQILRTRQKIPSQILPQFHAETLEQIIRQRLVQIDLKRLGKTADRQTIKDEMKKQEDRFAAQNSSLEETLTSRGISLAEYRRDLRFDINWKNFVAQQLTDERLQQYFEQHRRHFDGRQVRASHILLRPEQIDSPRQVVQAIGRARQLRQQIEAGQIRFAEAAKKHSDGPSASRGGDLGFFPRRGVLVKTFSQAAFQLDVRQISQPVVTKFGVHLIQVTAVRPGSLSWSQSREPLRAAAAKELFQQLANRERKTTPVQYTGTMAHLDPDSGRVVLPGRKQAL